MSTPMGPVGQQAQVQQAQTQPQVQPQNQPQNQSENTSGNIAEFFTRRFQEAISAVDQEQQQSSGTQETPKYDLQTILAGKGGFLQPEDDGIK